MMVDGMTMIDSSLLEGDEEFEIAYREILEDAISDSNGVSLSEARANFKKFGAYCNRARRTRMRPWRFFQMLRSGRYPGH
jgi:hypothetical protein